MFRQRTKLAHRVSNSPSSTVPGSGTQQRWPDQSQATPPPPQPQFYNPNALGPSPAPSPGPPQQPQQPQLQQQQVWQQPTPAAPAQQFPGQQQQQQLQQPQQPQQQQQQGWYDQQSKPANNNNYSNNSDPWAWGQQPCESNEQPTQPQWPQNNFPQQNQGYQQPQQQYPTMNNQQQQPQGFPPQQQPNDSWNWSSGGQDSSWNWGSEDSSPSTGTEASNGPQQQQQQHQPGQQQYVKQYTQPEQPKFGQEQPQFIQEQPQFVQEQPKYNQEPHTQQYVQQQQQQEVQQYNQQQYPGFNEHSQAYQYNYGQVEPEVGKVTEQLADVSLQDSLNKPTTDHQEPMVNYSVSGGDSSLSYQQEEMNYPSNGSLTEQDSRRDSMINYPVSGRDSGLSYQKDEVDYLESRRDTRMTDTRRESESSRRESSLDPRLSDVRNNVTPDLIATETPVEQHTEGQQPIQVEENVENTQQPPDLVTDFENREIVPPELYSRSLYGAEFGGQMSKLNSSSLVAAMSVNLESMPDNIERPEDTTTPRQSITPPPPSPPLNQGRVGVGQDDPSPWPSTIPPPENQEVAATSLPPPPPMSSNPRRHPRPPIETSPPLPPPPSSSTMDPVAASDRNQFLETGQLSADISMFSRRQTIPGESRQSPEPGVMRVIPGTTEPDEPTPSSQRSETIGSDFGESRSRPTIPIDTNLRTNAEGFNNEPVRIISNNTELRPSTEGIRNEPRSVPVRTHAEGTNNPSVQPPRSVLGTETTTRTSAEGRGRPQPPAMVPPPSRSQERLSAFTEVPQRVEIPSRVEVPLRVGAEGDHAEGSDVDDGEISDLDNISSGEAEREDGELDESTEDRSKDDAKKTISESREVVNPEVGDSGRPPSGSGRRNDRLPSRKERPGSGDKKKGERGASGDRRSPEQRDRTRGKPPRHQDDRKKVETRGTGRHRRRDYDDDDSDSYVSERGSGRDEVRRRRGHRSPDKTKPPRSIRHGREYYREDYREDYRHRDYRYDDHYNREKSRPSSRAGSEVRRDYESDHSRSHKDGRDGRERGARDKPPPGPYYDKYRRPDPRDPYYARGYEYYARGGYDYPPRGVPPAVVVPPPIQHPEYGPYTFAYFEELRRTNPAAYADWYRKYFASAANVSQVTGPGSGTFDGFPEDEHNSRGSVHSGRSSINDEISGIAGGRRSPAAAPRLTPAKFGCAHAVAKLCAQGKVVHVLPHSPRDGQNSTVLIHDLGALLDNDPMMNDLKAFPGPLVAKGPTNKHSVLQFCMMKIRSAHQDPHIYDRDSYILVWKLLILLVKQNGTVVGADIAELLLGDQKELMTMSRSRSPSPSGSSRDDSEHHSRGDIRRGESEATDRFRQSLLYGNTKDALDLAMKQGLWGHALFLASKMDARTYASVMTRFANGLPLNDPLQTLYQLMSGRQPAAVTCVADEKWGDWKPHLAMILSNPTQRPELDHRAITTLGDTLGSRGCLHASHFCYLLAQLEFGSHGQQPPAKLVLLGSSHTTLPFEAFSTCEAIQCTEVYEYARRLADPNFYLPHFQTFKFMYACRLVEHGFTSEGLQYCEEIANALLTQPLVATTSCLAAQVAELTDSLKLGDPLWSGDQQLGSPCEENFYLNDPTWLQQLRSLSEQTQDVANEFGGVEETATYTSVEYQQQVSQDVTQQGESVTYTDEQWQQYYYNQQQWEQQQQQQLSQQTQQPSEPAPVVNEAPVESAAPSEPPNSGYWQPQQQPSWSATPENGQQSLPWSPGPAEQAEPTVPDTNSDQAAPPAYDYWNMPTQTEPDSAPTITLPGSRPRQKTLSESSIGSLQQRSPSKNAKSPGQQGGPQVPGQAGGGWLGGLWNKISLRPKNQMKLPDDKNPTIVWDADRKRWVNKDADEEEVSADLRPPPRIPVNSVPSFSHNAAPTSQSPGSMTQAPPSLGGGSGYKLSGGSRGMRKNYVNVLQPNSTSSTSASSKPLATDVFPSVAPSSNLNYFVPAPVSDSDATQFATPASSAPESPQTNSDSDPSANVQSVPMMYNPSQFVNGQR